MNNNGFTLLEMLMVLFIVGLISFVMSFNYLTTSYRGPLNKEAQYLGSTLETMKLKSLTTNKESYIQIDSSGFKCFLGDTLIFEHSFFKPLEISSNFIDTRISITSDGTVSKAGSIEMSYKEDEVTLIVNIGAGRYRVE